MLISSFHCPRLAFFFCVNGPWYCLTAVTHIPRPNRITSKNIHQTESGPFIIHDAWSHWGHRTLHRNAHFDSHEGHLDGRNPFSEVFHVVNLPFMKFFCRSLFLLHLEWCHVATMEGTVVCGPFYRLWLLTWHVTPPSKSAFGWVVINDVIMRLWQA